MLLPRPSRAHRIKVRWYLFTVNDIFIVLNNLVVEETADESSTSKNVNRGRTPSDYAN